MKGAALMDYIRGVSRQQVTLFPEAIEDYITADNPVRFIDAFVSKLDLVALGFQRAHPAETGRAGLRSRRPFAALPLWLSESGALVAAAGARDQGQYRSDVASSLCCAGSCNCCH